MPHCGAPWPAARCTAPCATCCAFATTSCAHGHQHEPLIHAAGPELLESLAEQVRRHRHHLRRRIRAQRQQGTNGGHCPETIVLDYLDRY